MANIKISELTALTPPDAADLVPVTDASASQTKRTTVGEIVGIINGDVDVANDGTATISELPVSKLQDGSARQLLQTDAAGTGVEWTSDVDVPGTLDVTGAATLDSTLGVNGQSTLASAAVSDLTSGRVVLAGTSGELEDSAGLTFNGTQLDVDGNVVITGELKHIGGGSEGSPAVYFDGSAPSNSLYVQAATGNVGIKTNSVSAPLHVKHADTATTGLVNGLKLQQGSATNGNRLSLVFSTLDNYTVAGVNGVIETHSGTELNNEGRLEFYTKTSGDSVTERMRITSDGKVGVGSTNVDELLHVESDGATPKIKVESTLANSSPGFRVTNDARTYDIRIDGTNDNLQFYDATASEGRVAIDSSGRLLVGTSSSLDVGAGLQIAVNSSFSDFYPLEVFHFDSTDNTQGPTAIYTRSKSDTIGTISAVNADDGLGTILFRGAGTSAYVDGALIKAEVESGTISNTSMPSRLVFSTTGSGSSSPTERMRIDKDGNHFTYGDTNNCLARVGTTGTGGWIYWGAYGATSITTGTQSFGVYANGDVVNDNNSYGPLSSDQRLKQDITDANSQWDDIKNIRITNFHYKNDPAGPLHLGPIAQELEQVSPGLITRRPVSDDEIADPSNDLMDGDEVLSFKASILYMKAVKALQEAMERIETLESKVAALEAQ